MVEVTVQLQNKTVKIRDVIEITKEELEQYACNVAREKWYQFNFNKITTQEIKLTLPNSLQIDKNK